MHGPPSRRMSVRRRAVTWVIRDSVNLSVWAWCLRSPAGGGRGNFGPDSGRTPRPGPNQSADRGSHPPLSWTRSGASSESAGWTSWSWRTGQRRAGSRSGSLQRRCGARRAAVGGGQIAPPAAHRLTRAWGNGREVPSGQRPALNQVTRLARNGRPTASAHHAFLENW